jgi:hypothetical protein
VISGTASIGTAIPSLTTNDVWKLAFNIGGGVKFLLREHLLRVEFRDYLTMFPRQQTVPAPHNTARGIFQQFTPTVGVGVFRLSFQSTSCRHSRIAASLRDVFDRAIAGTMCLTLRLARAAQDAVEFHHRTPIRSDPRFPHSLALRRWKLFPVDHEHGDRFVFGADQ